MTSLVQNLWIPDNRRIILQVDSYRDGVFQGRFYGMGQEEVSFTSLSQFLLMMEELLERCNEPQSSTTRRSFSSLLYPQSGPERPGRPGGKLATFELKILFRQHSSWQGAVLWREWQMEKHFRSALELILLLDSALRQLEEKTNY